MFIARAAVLALLGVAAPNAAAENLRHLKNGAIVSPAGPKGEGFGEPGARYGQFCALVLGTLVAFATEGGGLPAFDDTYTQVSQYVVNKNGKGKYTCHAKDIDYDGLVAALGVTELSGQELLLADACKDIPAVEIPIPDEEPLMWPGGCPCNPGDPNSYDWTIKATPSGNAQMKCSFQLPQEEEP